MGRSVEAVFHSKPLKSNISGRVAVPASAIGIAMAARIACNDHAWDNGYTHYAYLEPIEKVWRVYECRGRSDRVWLIDLPSQAAAEMWLVHRG